MHLMLMLIDNIHTPQTRAYPLLLYLLYYSVHCEFTFTDQFLQKISTHTIMAYLAPIHRGTSVRHAIKLKLLSPDEESLILA